MQQNRNIDMGDTAIFVEHLTVRLNGREILRDISFKINHGECLAIIGKTGSGKTTLIKALMGQLFLFGKVSLTNRECKRPYVVVITRQHRFNNLSNLSSFYYQQRFNSFDAEDAQTVEDELKKITPDHVEIKSVLQRLKILHVINSRLIELSNGEQKRLQLAKALLQHPEFILFDNPYVGLDVEARKILNEIIDELVMEGIHILLVTGSRDIPNTVTHVAILNEGKIDYLQSRQEFMLKKSREIDKEVIEVKVNRDFENNNPSKILLDSIPQAYGFTDFDMALKMVNVNVQYHGKMIVQNVNWEVQKGTCWNLTGHNGSGKSTLLSLVNGDNPQAFANEIYLFDRRKGSGESIWDIKRQIGYFSPELHYYFDSGANCVDIVASGLFDTVGLFRKLNEEQKSISLKWMQVFMIEKFADKPFQYLSDGEQRLVLLARAMVKNPPFLILDEPCQGLDDQATSMFIELINHICVNFKKTLIYVSHYAAEIPPCVQNRITIQGGMIISSGTIK